MRRFLVILAVACGVSMSSSVVACELDGLSHGYGPLSAMFAGAHRYQSLNGTDESEEETVAVETEVKTAVAPSATPPTPPSPRRSFVAWAKAKPKPSAAEAPSGWSQSTPLNRSPSASSAPKPPSGGPIP